MLNAKTCDFGIFYVSIASIPYSRHGEGGVIEIAILEPGFYRQIKGKAKKKKN